jgi:hypothetical protein
MKKLLFFASVLLASVLIIISCSKNEDLVQATLSIDNEKGQTENLAFDDRELTEVGANEIYMIDNEIVSASTFQWNVEGMIYHINMGEKDNPNSQNLYYMAFTSQNDYDVFMRSEIGNKYDTHQAIIAHLRNYAQSSGAVDYLEQHGTVPQFYLDYERRYLADNLPQEVANANQQRTLMGVLFKDKNCRKAFNLTIPLLGTPFFIFNNNQASSFEGLFIGGYHTCFDRAFYLDQLFGLTVWGVSCFSFSPGVDDRASSWWSIGI